ncbi:MAG: glutamine amidotransferase [Armatimonadota bacterium]
MRILSFIILLLLCIGPSLAASIQVTKGADGKDRLLLTTGQIRLRINPSRGGRVDSFRYAPWGEREIVKDKNHGLCNDHFWQEYWPGQFWEAQYSYKILANGPDEVSVRLSCLSQNKGVPQVAGIMVDKTYTIRENDRVIRVVVSLTNTTAEGKFIGYWLQNVCWLGGEKAGDQYFRTTKRGISQTSSNDANPPDAGFIREPQAGWTAAVDSASKDGLVFLMDYDDLWFLYNCTPANTIEWQYDAVAIPPGKSWETAVSIIPTSDLDTVSYASEQLLAGVTIREDKAAGKLEVTQTFEAVAGALPSLETSAGLETLVTNKVQPPTPPQRLTDIGLTPRTVKVTLPYDTRKREPAVLRLSWKGSDAQGKPLMISPEFWHAGSFVSNTHPTDGSPFYAIPSRPKQKTLLKPDTIARIVSPAPKVLFLKGFLSPAYQVNEAVAALDPKATVTEVFAYTGVFGPQLDAFPYDYDILMGYDLVVLGDLSIGHLGDVALEMLKDYVTHGGNLLVLGGPFAYGNGKYQGSVLNEMLPVTCRGPFDIKPGKGKITAEAPFDTIASLTALQCSYLHQVTAKPDGTVLLAQGTAPLLTIGKSGKGTVCCFTGTPLGKKNGTATPQWREVLARLLPRLGVKR